VGGGPYNQTKGTPHHHSVNMIRVQMLQTKSMLFK
jgi:hypothetical protein